MNFTTQLTERKHFTNRFILFCLIFLVMLVCAGFTSPLYPYYNGLDSSMFLLTAKGLLQGKINYLDLFDHKGPIFFWLEAIGYAFGGRYGVWSLECVLACIDISLVLAICKKIGGNPFIGTLSATVIFLYTFQHGNLTEEFSLPFIFWGIYYELSFLSSERKKHPPKYAFIYGVLFGIVAFSRINNAILLCSLVFCIGIVLISNKQWGNLLTNFVMGILGIAIVTIPVCVYFYLHGALSDMLYATFLHNLLYAKSKTHLPIFPSNFIRQLICFLPGIFSSTVFICNIKKNRRLYISLLFSSILVYGMLSYTNIYLHYFMLGLPLFAIASSSIFSENVTFECSFIASSKALLQGDCKKLKVFCLSVMALYALLSAYSACAPIYKTYLTDIAADKYEQVSSSLSIIPQDERSSVIGYDVLPDCYLYGDIVPCYKYYTLQEWMTSEKRDVYGEFVHYIAEEHPLWVITSTTSNNPDIQDILHADYSLMISDDYCNYYRYTE